MGPTAQLVWVKYFYFVLTLPPHHPSTCLPPLNENLYTFSCLVTISFKASTTHQKIFGCCLQTLLEENPLQHCSVKLTAKVAKLGIKRK